MAVDAHGMPLRVLITAGLVADCTQADQLIKNMQAQCLLADRGYDTDAIVDQGQRQGMQVVIPAKKNRKNKRDCDMALYKHRHLVENAFYHLKRWRSVAARYAKNASSFLAAVQIRCIDMWIKIS